MKNHINSAARILIVVPHFFNVEENKPMMFGSHETKNIKNRRKIVENSNSRLLEELRTLEVDFEVVYLGLKNNSLMPLQAYVESDDPRYLPWLACDYAFSNIDDYDFICILEDDLEIEFGTLKQLLHFQSSLDMNTTLIPNRIEVFEGIRYCTDLIAMPGWKGPKFEIGDLTVREPVNIHSGFLFLGREKFKKAYQERPFEKPTKIIGDYMASAFANIHAYLRVVRAVPLSSKITVIHHDNWVQRMIENQKLNEDEARLLIRETLLD